MMTIIIIFSSYDYYFIVNDQKIEGNFTDLGKNIKLNDLIYVNYLINSPRIEYPVRNIKVPKCFKMENAPQNGWKLIPKDTCR